jgi:hypothetical protein
LHFEEKSTLYIKLSTIGHKNATVGTRKMATHRQQQQKGRISTTVEVINNNNDNNNASWKLPPKRRVAGMRKALGSPFSSQ